MGGHVTLYLISWYDSFKKVIILFMVVVSARVGGLELPTFGFGDQRSTN